MHLLQSGRREVIEAARGEDTSRRQRLFPHCFRHRHPHRRHHHHLRHSTSSTRSCRHQGLTSEVHRPHCHHHRPHLLVLLAVLGLEPRRCDLPHPDRHCTVVPLPSVIVDHLLSSKPCRLAASFVINRFQTPGITTRECASIHRRQSLVLNFHSHRLAMVRHNRDRSSVTCGAAATSVTCGAAATSVTCGAAATSGVRRAGATPDRGRSAPTTSKAGRNTAASASTAATTTA